MIVNELPSEHTDSTAAGGEDTIASLEREIGINEHAAGAGAPDATDDASIMAEEGLPSAHDVHLGHAHKVPDQFHGHVDSLHARIEQQEHELTAINDQLAQAERQKRHLLLLKEMLHALLQLRSATTRLSDTQKKIDELSKGIEELGAAAEEHVRERDDLKKQLEDSIAEHTAKLEEGKGKLTEFENMLAHLKGEEDTMRRLVTAWKGRVSELHEMKNNLELADAGAEEETGEGGVEVHPHHTLALNFPEGVHPDSVPAATDEEAGDLAAIDKTIHEIMGGHAPASKKGEGEEKKEGGEEDAVAALTKAVDDAMEKQDSTAFAQLRGAALMTRQG